MLAVHLEGGRVEVRRQPLPRIAKGFARIRLLAAGICSTDLQLRRGYYGFRGTPGHEFVGEVTEAEDSTWIGKRVVGEINLACGACESCARGLGRHCPSRRVLGIVNYPGAFREFLTLPLGNLHRVPRSILTRSMLSSLNPSRLLARFSIKIKLSKGDSVAVLGDGKLGLLIAQVLHAHGAEVHLFGRHRHKLRIAESAGITGELIGEKMPERAYGMVVEATGSAQALQSAIAMCEPRGTVVMKSTLHGLVPIDTAPAIVNEITLVGSRCGRFEPALRLLASGKVRVDRFISEEFGLDRAPMAFDRAATKGILKVLLRPPR